MSVDNRTIINDCEANTGWTGDDSASTDTDAGSFYEGSTALTWQAGAASEQMSTTEDSVGATTFSLDWSDSTLYMLTKDNLSEGFSTGGVQFVIGDGTNITGYNVGGNDAAGIILPLFYSSYKLDVSVVVATPGSFTDHAGTEASLDQTQITAIGLGLNHTADAMGPSDNTTMDCFRYIANDSYALTINGGTSGTPETMTDVAGDDVTNGWGMVSNPLGSQFLFFAPTEWGEASASADHYFTASNEQWFWIGDNGGGHATGVGHFIFRVVGNATDTGSFVIDGVVIVNTGTAAALDLSDTDIDTLEIDLSTMIGLSTVAAPSAGGTSRFCTNTSFLQCGTITHNGADMDGCSILESTVAADTGALVYNETSDPNGEMDNMTFSIGGNAHHAVEFGTSAPATMTIPGMTTTGFNASDANNDSTFLFPDTGSDVDWVLNLPGYAGNATFKKVRAGDTVDLVVDPVTFTVNVQDEAKAALEGARVVLFAGTTGNLNAEAAITSITRSTTTATVTTTAAHNLETGDVVLIDDTVPTGALDNEAQFTGLKTIIVTGGSTFTYAVLDQGATTATRTYEFWDVLINYELTNGSGVADVTRTLGADQSVQGTVYLSTGSRQYKPGDITGTMTSASGGSTTVTMLDD